MVQNRIILFVISLLSVYGLYGQQTDSIKTHILGELVIESARFNDLSRLPSVQNTRLYSGKKTEVINVQNLDLNIAEKTPRQVFAKVPGVFVYDMDGSGNQTNISTRGLDPHRGWEFNLRANGVITNSDMYGYPASHFSLPMEAIEKIELVRGTGSLQYGAQFGGMINYVTHAPDTLRKIKLELVSAAGSYGLMSLYIAAHGTIGKFKYYIFGNKRVSNGYRENGKTEYDAESVSLYYEPSKNLQLKVGIDRSNYVYQIPGPLTDSMFYQNPQLSTRARNYFNPEIFVPSVSADWRINRSTQLYVLSSAVLGARNSVQFDKPANIKDDIDPITLSYDPRQVDIDHFNSYTTEVRVLHRYSIGKIRQVLAGGLQLIHNDLHRQQLGKGTTGTDFDLTLTDPQWGRDLHFKTKNVAFFLENSIQVYDKLVVNPGVRFERGNSAMTGVIVNYDENELPSVIDHNFVLFGVNAEFRLNDSQQLYAGWSQAYRPVIFKDIIPASTYERVDKNLKDAKGYNFEAGYRGDWNNFGWDVSVFQLRYNNRMGSQSLQDETDNSFYILRTNVGNSLTNGVEIYGEYNFFLHRKIGITCFTSTSLFEGRYDKASLRVGQENVDISGNKLESVPELISRNGLTFRYNDLSLSFLYSYTAKTFADAANTINPSATGAVGIVPSYGVLDITSSIVISKLVLIRLNINNALDTSYFTKRPAFYPGPGVWSSDGRTINCSIQIRI